MSIHLTKRATSDIQKIYNHSIQEWGLLKAEEYLDSIEESLRILEKHPNLLTKKAQISEHFHSYQVGSHWLIFDIQGKEVFLLTVQHISLNLLDSLPELEPKLHEEMKVLHWEVKRKK